MFQFTAGQIGDLRLKLGQCGGAFFCRFGGDGSFFLLGGGIGVGHALIDLGSRQTGLFQQGTLLFHPGIDLGQTGGDFITLHGGEFEFVTAQRFSAFLCGIAGLFNLFRILIDRPLLIVCIAFLGDRTLFVDQSTAARLGHGITGRF
ncbi:hypothetical protein Dace_0034 [Desulfuromonas acetoxidans DSM 684]|uniref:Uncharacterized protein n=1 Tax=Desulfuromonas acetoxidans (strain DSM 684 / 11070) TaxID=281689 RepID=Q1JVA1_DESA6|nr:hypothetical protein Dace_0034 [Desulfuromonas acetoxidans DSM 684]